MQHALTSRPTARHGRSTSRLANGFDSGRTRPAPISAVTSVKRVNCVLIDTASDFPRQQQLSRAKLNGEMTDDPFDLGRFVTAQDRVYETVLAELRAGAKRSHWIWFVFPQLRGLGRSSTAQHYGIASADEAAAYLAHPVLGRRLRECAALLSTHADRSATEMLGYPDDLKVRSSMTLFARVGHDPVFREVLDTFYGGSDDPATLDLLS